MVFLLRKNARRRSILYETLPCILPLAKWSFGYRPPCLDSTSPYILTLKQICIRNMSLSVIRHAWKSETLFSLGRVQVIRRLTHDPPFLPSFPCGRFKKLNMSGKRLKNWRPWHVETTRSVFFGRLSSSTSTTLPYPTLPYLPSLVSPFSLSRVSHLAAPYFLIGSFLVTLQDASAEDSSDSDDDASAVTTFFCPPPPLNSISLAEGSTFAPLCSDFLLLLLLNKKAFVTLCL
jgi:hypothetical protein